MQQTLYTPLAAANTAKTNGIKKDTAARRTEIRRWIARKWDVLVILALMAASLAYGLFAVGSVA